MNIWFGENQIFKLSDRKDNYSIPFGTILWELKPFHGL
jgi:hypothetical protein